MQIETPRGPRLRKITYTDHDKTRFSIEKAASKDERSPFERDRARIIHSAAFRRLQGKTQVFTVGEGDFFRTRLTHSLEVAQIGKGLALRLGADTDLVEAVCLAHDIGHPPFGHAGEDELKKLMKCYGGFEANAQNIRVLTKLETKSMDYRGLNLTRAVIDGQLKYKQVFPKNRDKFIYESDFEIMNWADKEACAENGKSNPKSFECQIMDWADDIAYAVHDLEDGIHTGYIDANTFQDQSGIDEVIAEVEKEMSNKLKNSSGDIISEACYDLIKYLLDQNPDFRMVRTTKSHRERKANRKQLTRALIGRYVKASSRGRMTDVPENSISSRYLYSVQVCRKYEIEVCMLQKLVRRFVIRTPQILTLEEKARHIVRSLFEKLMEVDNVERLLPDDWKEHLEGGSSNRHTARVVSDYISGMTDNYAQKTYARLFLPAQGSIYDAL